MGSGERVMSPSTPAADTPDAPTVGGDRRNRGVAPVGVDGRELTDVAGVRAAPPCGVGDSEPGTMPVSSEGTAAVPDGFATTYDCECRPTCAVAASTASDAAVRGVNCSMITGALPRISGAAGAGAGSLAVATPAAAAPSAPCAVGAILRAAGGDGRWWLGGCCDGAAAASARSSALASDGA